MCVCASQKSQFCRRANVARTRAGGVSPPWLHDRDCNGVRQRAAGRQCAEQLRKRLRKCVSATHRGLTPAALGAERDELAEYVRNRAGHTIGNRTAGSRSPLLALIVRVYIAKVAIPSADERARTRAGGRKPPVVAATLMHHKTLYRTVTLAHANKSGGGVSPPWLRQRNRNGVRQHAGRRSTEQVQ